MRYYCFIVTVIICFFVLVSADAFAAKSSILGDNSKNISSKPALIEAENLSYDKVNQHIVAEGNVEIIQGDRILLADKIIYDKRKDSVNAIGNISLMEPDGTILFAHEVELRDGLKDGVVNHFSAKLSDGSLFAAQKGEKVNEDVTILSKAVYSPCPLCKENPDKAPMWQIKADSAKIDEKEEQVSYKNAYFELYGVPVAYTPYFFHATPDAKRKSGFLTPEYSADSIFGTIISTPYYWNISPSMDATITPVFTSREGPIAQGEFRHLLDNGSYELSGSITNPDEVDDFGNKTSGRNIRGHIKGKGLFSINDKWNVGFDGERSTDDTYLRRYKLSDADLLTSKLYAESVNNRSYTLAQAISFQGLTANDDPGATPLILPHFDHHREGKIDYMNSRWTFDANALALYRDEGTSSSRLSIQGGWHIPYLTNSGHLFEVTTSLRTDGYIVDEVTDPGNNTRNLDGFESRFIPQAELKWSYPLVKLSKGRKIFIEPTSQFIVAPYGGNPEKIPDEDSQDVEFSDENLFSTHHFNGLDRVESGPRANYGFRGGINDINYGDLVFLFGQNYRVKKDQYFSEKSGLDNYLSDLVGRVGYNKDGIFDLAYSFRLDNRSFKSNKNYITSRFNLDPLELGLDYLFLEEFFDESATTGLSRELVLATYNLDITEDIELSGKGHRDLEKDDWVYLSSDLLYKGDCIDLIVSWYREFTRDRDIKPNTTVSFSISLKNLNY